MQRSSIENEDAFADLTDNGRLDSMVGMYEAELQELHSAEGQLCQLANDLARTMSHPELAFRPQEYATELQSRRVDLERLLARIGTFVSEPGLRAEDEDGQVRSIEPRGYEHRLEP